jgi:rubrerythrin
MKREQDAAHLESSGGGFRAFGRTYQSERAAVVSLIDKICAGEANAADAFGAWADQCTTESLRSALRMVAEREASHARVFERRMRDLGAERRAGATAEGRHLSAFLSDSHRNDAEKLTEFVRVTGDPAAALEPIRDFAARLADDLETREALRLFIDAEASTLKWALSTCSALGRGVAKT